VHTSRVERLQIYSHFRSKSHRAFSASCTAPQLDIALTYLGHCTDTMKRPATTASSEKDRLRKHCRAEGLYLQWWDDKGHKHSLTKAELDQLSSKEEKRAEALRKISTALDPLGVAGEHIERGHAFWHSDAPGRGGWQTRQETGVLRQADALGIWSACTKAQLSVHLWVYHKCLQGVPSVEPGKLVLRDAEQLMPWAEYCDLRARGYHIAHCSDIIRFRACQCEGGWWLDGDTLWFRPPPPQSLSAGHAITLAPSKKVQGYTIDADKRHWLVNYLRVQGERARVTTPFCIPAGSHFAHAILAWLQDLPPADTAHRDYNFIMNKVGDLAEECGLASSFLPPHVLAPIPYFLCAGNLGKRGYFDSRREYAGVDLASKEELLGESVGQAWVSSKRTDSQYIGGKGPTASTSAAALGLMRFEDGSFAEALFQHLGVPENVAKLVTRLSVTEVRVCAGESLALTPGQPKPGLRQPGLAGREPPWLRALPWIAGEDYLAVVALCKSACATMPGAEAGARFHFVVEAGVRRALAQWHGQGLSSIQCHSCMAQALHMWRSGAPWTPCPFAVETALHHRCVAAALSLAAWKLQSRPGSRVPRIAMSPQDQGLVLRYEIVLLNVWGNAPTQLER
jgi:hypothetical protein